VTICYLLLFSICAKTCGRYPDELRVYDQAIIQQKSVAVGWRPLMVNHREAAMEVADGCSRHVCALANGSIVCIV